MSKNPKKKTTTKIIEIDGEDDYSAMVFADEVIDESYRATLWNHAMKSPDRTFNFLLPDGSQAIATAHEFPRIPVEFIDFMRDFQDYDQRKAHDWFVVDDDA